MNRIVLIDLSQRELNKRRELEQRVSRLTAVEHTKTTSGGLTKQQEEDLDKTKALLDSDAPVDPLYQAVAAHVARCSWDELVKTKRYILKHGLFSSQRNADNPALDDKEREIAGICGLLQIDGLVDPSQKNFVRRITTAEGEYRVNEALFDKAFELFSRRFVVSLGSQIDSGLLSEHIVGCVHPNESFSGRKAKAAVGHTQSYEQTPRVPERADIIAAVSARDLAQMVRRLAADGINSLDAREED